MEVSAIIITRYVFYMLDFIFGTMSWGIVSNRLKGARRCYLNKLNVNIQDSTPCDAVIALGVIAMILLIAVVVLRTFDVLGTFTFPEYIEILALAFLVLIWLIVAIITVTVTNSFTRSSAAVGSDVKVAIAGAWLAFVTHSASLVAAVFAQRVEDK